MTAGTFPKVSVCLLNYRGLRYVDACLDALRRLDPAPAEILLVDNGSDDGSLERLRARSEEPGGPTIRLLPTGSNLGYAAGHNRGASVATGEFLAFLNVTVEPEPAWLEVVRWMEGRPDVAFAQPATFHRADPGRLESLGSLLSPSGRLTVLGRDHRERTGGPREPYVAEIFSVLGAAFVARADVFRRLGGFDESMFMYFEETDLCWRGWMTGHRTVCWFDPSRPTRVYHTVHGTHSKGFDVARYFERNRTLAMFRNLESSHLSYLIPNIATVVSESARTPRRFLRYASEVLQRLPESGRRRRALQRGRTVKDARLFSLRPPAGLDDRFRPA